jgi:small subunit ribosomal protein S16
MVKIRLAQTGSTNRRQYRLIAIEEGKRRDGRAIEILGYYNPQVKPSELVIKRERVDYWLARGAQLTPAARALLEKTTS